MDGSTSQAEQRAHNSKSQKTEGKKEEHVLVGKLAPQIGLGRWQHLVGKSSRRNNIIGRVPRSAFATIARKSSDADAELLLIREKHRAGPLEIRPDMCMLKALIQVILFELQLLLRSLSGHERLPVAAHLVDLAFVVQFGIVILASAADAFPE